MATVKKAFDYEEEPIDDYRSINYDNLAEKSVYLDFDGLTETELASTADKEKETLKKLLNDKNGRKTDRDAELQTVGDSRINLTKADVEKM
mmetsp:Transcript_30823/g.27264  ORF Transcript_30823/g.27264 Transcript_30823/m.27264 type:complete len:91 (+) Transcript_30823:47-319(+)